jgi:acetylornithine deacetylase/succinyl-diaminopimelate desuccinylase-like protein
VTPLGYVPDLDAIRGDVVALAARERSSTRAGERASARWLALRLRELGAADVELQPYRFQRTYAMAHGLHNVAGIAACALGGPAGAALAVATLRSYEREVSGVTAWVRRIPGRGEGLNVIARLEAAGPKRATLVLVAHHDAANTGFVWHPRVVAAGARRHLRRRSVDPFMAPIALAFGLAVAGGLLPRHSRAGRAARALGAALLAAGVAVDVDVARSPTVPGASDNATGVAVCLDLARHLTAAPLDGVEVLVALTGAEEAGMGGMAAFLDRRSELDPRACFVLGLDTLGAGEAIVCRAEGAMRDHTYAERDLALVEEGAAAAGTAAPRWRIGGWTDPILAVHRGIPAASLLSMGPGYFPHYHHPSDTPDNVNWKSVEACARIAAGTTAAFDRRVAAGGWR